MDSGERSRKSPWIESDAVAGKITWSKSITPRVRPEEETPIQALDIYHRMPVDEKSTTHTHKERRPVLSPTEHSEGEPRLRGQIRRFPLLSGCLSGAGEVGEPGISSAGCE